MNEKNFRDPNPWNVNWYHWHRWYGGWKRSPTAQGSTTLRVPKPLLRQTGEFYEVEVNFLGNLLFSDVGDQTGKSGLSL